MAFYQWRRFNFFDIAKDVDGGGLHEALNASSAQVTCVTSGRGYILLGDDIGRVHCLNRRLAVSSFKAFEAWVHAACQVRQTSLLVCVGKDDDAQSVLKVFDLDKVSQEGSGPPEEFNPQLVRTTTLGTTGHHCATCVAVEESVNLVAVGFSDGSVTLLRGDVSRDRGTRRKNILGAREDDGNSTSCSGLAFKTAGKAVWLYVATTKQVMAFNVTVRDKETCSVLDSIGCEKNMAVQVHGLPDVHFITNRSDAVYFYTQDGRGQCYPIEGEKTGIYWFRNYLVVASNNAKSASGGVDDAKNTLTVFDVQNKFIAYTSPIKPVLGIASEWGTLFVIARENRRLYQLTEKDIQSKLDLLFKKNFYDVAIKVAKSSRYDSFGMVDIFRQYGDHLYAKGDFAGAIDNYVKTIGHLEPSYVIRKFLDTHRIHDLTTYMRALHAKGLANKDHTILLLNCYTKLKDEKRLDEFIFKESNDFDVGIAIRVLRQAAYNSQALMLAERHGMHELYLEIELDDVGDHGRALEYIARLEFAFAEASMRKYGGALLQHLPKETTAFLKLLCTSYRKIDEPLVTEEMLSGVSDESAAPVAASPDHFLHHFFKRPAEAIDFLEHIVERNPGSSPAVYNCLLENYLQTYSKAEGSRDDALSRRMLAVMDSPDASYDRDHLLVACQLHGFHRGTLHLYEKKELFGEILKHHIHREELGEAVATCRKHGGRNPGLWLQTLQFVASDCSAQPEQVSEILHQVERQNLMSPLLVVRTLSSSSGLQFGLVKEFLKGALKQEDLQARDDLARVEKYRGDTAKVQRRIDELRGDQVTFQETKCSLCPNKLDLPSVHFLCKHSFHLQCFQTFPESDSECPDCAKANKHIVDIIRSQCDSRDHHDSFHSRLEKAEDGFAVVADYFSRGMFRAAQRKEEKKPLPAVVREVAAEKKTSVTAAGNPFGDDFEGSPKPSGNPFGDPDEGGGGYDEELNPFK